MLKGTPRKVSRNVGRAGNPRPLSTELEQAVARRQGHLINETRIPRGNDVASGIRVGLDLLHQLGNLVGVGAVEVNSCAIVVVHRSEVAVFVGPLVPNADAVVLRYRCWFACKPQQPSIERRCSFLVNTESFLQIKTHLVAKHLMVPVPVRSSRRLPLVSKWSRNSGMHACYEGILPPAFPVPVNRVEKNWLPRRTSGEATHRP